MTTKDDLAALLKCLKQDPELLRGIGPKELEALVAELLASKGWLVRQSNTPNARHDILAVNPDPTGASPTTWLIDCKRYSAPQSRVNVTTAKSLLDSKKSLGLSNALLATTSDLSKNARDLCSAREDIQVLALVDLQKLLKMYRPKAKGGLYMTQRHLYSCFVCHSSADESFAGQLTQRLRQAGVHCWFAPEDLKAGRKIHEEIEKAIGQFDKFLLLLSPTSMKSNWVHHELRRAKSREDSEGCCLLFPIALTSMDEIQNWELLDPDSGRDLAVEVRKFSMVDFSNWQDPESFERSLRKLLKGLEHETEIHKAA